MEKSYHRGPTFRNIKKFTKAVVGDKTEDIVDAIKDLHISIGRNPHRDFFPDAVKFRTSSVGINTSTACFRMKQPKNVPTSDCSSNHLKVKLLLLNN